VEDLHRVCGRKAQVKVTNQRKGIWAKIQEQQGDFKQLTERRLCRE
jgi:hypothetical protein